MQRFMALDIGFNLVFDKCVCGFIRFLLVADIANTKVKVKKITMAEGLSRTVQTKARKVELLLHVWIREDGQK